MEWPDGRKRCKWANPKNPAYIRYHDEEWGKPVHDDAILFEMLVLETFQAGLSWECVLNKREAFRQAFDGFDLDAVCAFGEEKIASLMENGDIIRNSRKIRAAVNNARVFRAIRGQWGSFAAYLWHFTKGAVIHETGQSRSPLSDEVARDLKVRGMQFVGTVTVYAYLQSVGIIDSHDRDCFLEHRQGNIVVLFEAKPTAEGRQKYLDLAAMLKPLLAGYEGFVRAERFASLSEDGKLLSMNVWTDEAAVERWRNEVQHRLCQKEGRESLFSSYRITVCSTLREYTACAREQAPADSKFVCEK